MEAAQRWGVMRGRVPETWSRGCRLGSTKQRSSGCTKQRSSGCFCRLGRRRMDVKSSVFEETSCRTGGQQTPSSAQSTPASC